MAHISMSEVSTFLACRRSWEWGHRQKLTLPGESSAVALGHAVHAALERWYRSGEGLPIDHFHDYARETILDGGDGLPADQYKLGLAMMTQYVAQYGEDPKADRDIAEMLCSEQEFCVPIPETNGGWLMGTADGLFRDRRGYLWLIDHKTYSQPWNPALLVLNRQFVGYTWAFQLLAQNGALESYGVGRGERVHGLLFNGLRKQAAGPRVTSPLFAREWVERSPIELLLFQRQLAVIYGEIADPDTAVYPSPSQSCGWCDFQRPCVAKETGDDWKWMLDTLYSVKPSRGGVYEREETVVAPVLTEPPSVED